MSAYAAGRMASGLLILFAAILGVICAAAVIFTAIGMLAGALGALIAGLLMAVFSYVAISLATLTLKSKTGLRFVVAIVLGAGTLIAVSAFIYVGGLSGAALALVIAFVWTIVSLVSITGLIANFAGRKKAKRKRE